MKTNHQGCAVEYLDSARRRSDRTRLPVGVVNTESPAVEGTEWKMHARFHSARRGENVDAFDIVDLIEQTKAVGDADGVRKLKVSNAPRDDVDEPDTVIEELRKELSNRCIQIADLYNIQRQQVDALQVARDVIEDLDESVRSLREALAQHDNEVAAAKQALSRSEEEKNALQEGLEKTEKELAELMQKHLDLSTAFNEREVGIVCAQERVASLKSELCDKSAEMVKLTAGLEGRKDQCCNSAQFERRIEELEITLRVHDKQISALEDANAELSKCDDELTHKNMVLEAVLNSALKELESQNVGIESLKGALRKERQLAERKMAGLIGDLQRERAERSIAERETARIRNELALLLPKLAIAARFSQAA